MTRNGPVNLTTADTVSGEVARLTVENARIEALVRAYERLVDKDDASEMQVIDWEADEDRYVDLSRENERLRAALDAGVRAGIRAERQVAAVRALHVDPYAQNTTEDGVCGECFEDLPCPTLAALDAET